MDRSRELPFSYRMETAPSYLKMEILDLEIIQTLVGGAGFEEIEIYREVLGIFLAEKTKQLAGLQEAADEPDRECMNQILHSMGGAAANLGLIRLASACGYVAGATTRTEDEALSDLAGSLESEFRIALFELHRTLPALGLEERL